MLGEQLAYLQDVYRITGRKFGYFMKEVARGTLTKRSESPSSSRTFWNMAYEPDFAKGRKLYDLAKRKTWNPQTDIDWNNCIAPDQPLVIDQYWSAAQMGLADVLNEQERLELNHKDRNWAVSQLLHGEQGSMLLCAQLVDMRPDMDGKLFLASQVMDEARHTEVFRQYLEGKELFPADINIKFIIDSLLATSNWHKKAIGMLVLVEGYAMGAFNYIKRSNTDPCMSQILEFVMQDEGRHVGFGIDSIAEEVKILGEKDRQELEDYAFSLCRTLFYGRERGGFRSQVEMYWKADKGRMKLSRSEFENAAVTNRAMNEFQYDVFYNNLAVNLARTGLFSERVKPKYQSLGLPV